MVRPLPGRIATPRLTYRPVTDADRHRVVAGIGHDGVSRWLAAVPSRCGPADVEDRRAAGHVDPGVARASGTRAIADAPTPAAVPARAGFRRTGGTSGRAAGRLEPAREFLYRRHVPDAAHP